VFPKHAGRPVSASMETSNTTSREYRYEPFGRAGYLSSSWWSVVFLQTIARQIAINPEPRLLYLTSRLAKRDHSFWTINIAKSSLAIAGSLTNQTRPGYWYFTPESMQCTRNSGRSPRNYGVKLSSFKVGDV
jgi:hypothetical protein